MRIPPPLVALICLASTAWTAYRDGQLWHGWGAMQIAGIAVIGLGVTIDLLAVLQFRRANTTVNPLRPEKTSALVTTGLFALSRNPMYLGLAISLLGWSLLLQAHWGLLAIAVFVVWITRFQIPPEEAAMHARFGPAFDRYKATTRRWL